MFTYITFAIENKFCIIYSSFIGIMKIIPLHYAAWGKKRLLHILIVLHFLKHNEVDMHSSNTLKHAYVQNILCKSFIIYLQDHSKEFGCIRIYGKILFEVYIINVIIFQTC